MSTNLIKLAKQGGKMNPALYNNQVVSFTPKQGKKKEKLAYVSTQNFGFLKDEKGNFLVLTEKQIWECRAAYLEKFPNEAVQIAEAQRQFLLSEQVERIQEECALFAENCKQDSKYCKDLRNALKIQDWDFIAQILFENDSQLNEYIVLCSILEGDSYKGYVELIAEYRLQNQSK